MNNSKNKYGRRKDTHFFRINKIAGQNEQKKAQIIPSRARQEGEDEDGKG